MFIEDLTKGILFLSEVIDDETIARQVIEISEDIYDLQEDAKQMASIHSLINQADTEKVQKKMLFEYHLENGAIGNVLHALREVLLLSLQALHCDDQRHTSHDDIDTRSYIEKDSLIREYAGIVFLVDRMYQNNVLTQGQVKHMSAIINSLQKNLARAGMEMKRMVRMHTNVQVCEGLQQTIHFFTLYLYNKHELWGFFCEVI